MTLKAGLDKRRSGGYIAKGVGLEEGVHSDDVVREDWLGVGTLPFWPAEEAHHRRSKLDPPLQTSASSLNGVPSMALAMASAVC